MSEELRLILEVGVMAAMVIAWIQWMDRKDR